jgi:hypothetical protein
MAASDAWRWQWVGLVAPLAGAVLLLGKVWFHADGVVGNDQIAIPRIVANAPDFLLHPGRAPWAWPASAPGCLTDHLIGVAVIAAPGRLLGLNPVAALWVATALILALNGILLARLLMRWRVAPAAACLAGVLAVGLPVFVQRLQHANNLSLLWILAWAIAWDRFAEQPDARRAGALAAAGVGLAIMPATVLQFMAVAMPLLAAVALMERWPGWRTLALGAACQAPGFLLALWIYLPFVHHQYPPNLIVPSPWQDLGQPVGVIAWGNPHGQGSDFLASPGPAPVIGVLGLLFAIAVGHRRRLAIGLLVVVAADLALAVTVGGTSLVDHLRDLPLFGGMRSPARFAIPACVVALVGVALLVDAALARGRWRIALGVAAVALGGQMIATGGPVAPLRFIATDLPAGGAADVATISAEARPGPLLAIPPGILDDELALATGRPTAATTLGVPTAWHQMVHDANFDPAAPEAVPQMTRVITALQRQGLAAVVVRDGDAMPALAPILTVLGAKARATRTPGLTWWELPAPPPAPAGGWPSAVTVSAPGDGQWHVALTGEPGAAPVEGGIRSRASTWLLVPILPGTIDFDLAYPLAEGPPRLHFDRAIPVHGADGAEGR